MDKKAEKEIETEVKLRAQSQLAEPGKADVSGENSPPHLVVSDSDGPGMESEMQKTDSQNSEPPMVSSDASAESLLAQREHSGKDKKVGGGGVWFKRPQYLAVFVVTFLVLVFGCVGNFAHWYWNAPRHESPVTPFLTPAILTGCIGAPDAAYSLPLLPEVLRTFDEDDVATRSQRANREKFFTLGMANLNRFLERSGPMDQPISLLTKCTLLCKMGEPAEAARLFRPLADKYDSPMLKLYQGVFLTLSEDFKEAIGQLDEGAALAKSGKGTIHSSSFYHLWILKAEILQAMGRPEDALAVLNSPGLSERMANYATDNLQESKASVYLQLNQPDKAIVTACQVKKLDHFILSAAYLMKGDYDEAKNHAMDSDLALSRYYSNVGKLDEALKFAKNADRDSHTVVTREQVVYVLNQMARYKEALALSQNISGFCFLRSLPGAWQAIPTLRADRAYALAKSGDAKGALTEANKVLKNNPFSRMALEAARLAYQTLGDRVNEALCAKRIKELKNNVDFRPMPYFNTYPKH